MTSSSILQNLRVGADGLRATPLRTVLSTLGMIIGVGPLVAVLSVGDHVAVTAVRAGLTVDIGDATVSGTFGYRRVWAREPVGM